MRVPRIIRIIDDTFTVRDIRDITDDGICVFAGGEEERKRKRKHLTNDKKCRSIRTAKTALSISLDMGQEARTGERIEKNRERRREKEREDRRCVCVTKK